MIKVVNLKTSDYDTFIARPSKWGNPFSHLPSDKCAAEFKVGSRKEAIEKYEEWIRQQPELMAALHELDDKVLGCFCWPAACHGTVLVKLREEQLRNLPPATTQAALEHGSS
jgi:hypothetical protein